MLVGSLDHLGRWSLKGEIVKGWFTQLELRRKFGGVECWDTRSKDQTARGCRELNQKLDGCRSSMAVFRC